MHDHPNNTFGPPYTKPKEDERIPHHSFIHAGMISNAVEV